MENFNDFWFINLRVEPRELFIPRHQFEKSSNISKKSEKPQTKHKTRKRIQLFRSSLFPFFPLLRAPLVLVERKASFIEPTARRATENFPTNTSTSDCTDTNTRTRKRCGFYWFFARLLSALPRKTTTSRRNFLVLSYLSLFPPRLGFVVANGNLFAQEWFGGWASREPGKGWEREDDFRPAVVRSLASFSGMIRTQRAPSRVGWSWGWSR